MKAWQHGYDLDYLKELEGDFERFNSYSCSPFSAMKKNKIADRLHNNRLEITEDYILDVAISKVNGTFKTYLDVHLANKCKGDRIIYAMVCFAPTFEPLITKLRSYGTDTFIWVWEADMTMRKLVALAGYSYIGSKVSSFGEIQGLYFKQGVNVMYGEREHGYQDPLEQVGVKKLLDNIDMSDAISMLDLLNYSKQDYTNHYSNYNKGRSWSAISLRGYSDDPAFITKPSEMSKKWQQENDHVNFKMQDTPLREQYREVDRIFSFIDGDIHRIRLMKLTPDGGTLGRHTDLVDTDSGIAHGKLARLHFPVATNDDVKFTSWNFHDRALTVNMKVGECWYLDTRKPHMVVNEGDSDRIHLVIDVEVTDKLRALIDGKCI